LLAHTRAFQLRYDELGTHLHALTKSITVSGGMTGVLQGSLGNRPKDYNDVVGRGDVVFSFKVGDTTTAVIDMEATGGNGIDARLPNFSVLNGVAGSTDDRVRFREAWVEHSALNDRLIATIGKISLTNYFDSNAIANSENSQFLAGAFVNAAVLGAPANGPGVRVTARLTEPLSLCAGYGSGDADSADILDHGFGIAELGYKVKSGALEGNYRIYGSIDGALPDGSRKLLQKDALGFGVGIDQQLTDKLTLFGRYGQHDKEAYATSSAWSVGGQYSGLIPARKDDILGFAFGQINVIRAAQEKLSEVYYKAKVSDQIAITPMVQYLVNPEGNTDRNNVTMLGLRTQVIF
jgi:high affinity Mn2+ porin